MASAIPNAWRSYGGPAGARRLQRTLDRSLTGLETRVSRRDDPCVPLLTHPGISRRDRKRGFVHADLNGGALIPPPAGGTHSGGHRDELLLRNVSGAHDDRGLTGPRRLVHREHAHYGMLLDHCLQIVPARRALSRLGE